MKRKKIIIVLMLVLTIGIVGLTIAYFSNTSSITNIFSTKDYGTTVTEEFVSPDNWLPGTETDKTLTVTNSGSVDEAVRVSYTETWTSANSNVEGDLPLSQNNNVAALINWTNINDWTTVTENNKTYKYYNYKLAPNETTSELLDKVTFNPAITNSSTCEETESNGVKTITCNSNGNGYDGATYKLVFTIETVQYDKYIEAWGTNVVIASEKPQPAPTGVEYLASEATNEVGSEYNTTTKGKMFQFTHTLNAGTENETTVNELRYIGDAPNNYVYFNCDNPVENQEYNYAESCEVWRILGVFDVERTDPEDSTKTITEQRMKLVRGSILENRAFNSDSNNDWTIAPLNTYLNGDYYNGTVTNGLKQSARDMIGTAKYYLGAISWVDDVNGLGSVEKIYIEERGNNICKSCNNDISKLIWIGKVGLLYPSDMYMVYANGVNYNCYINPFKCWSSASPAGVPKSGWIYNTNILNGSSPTETWLISSPAESIDAVLEGRFYGYLAGYKSTNTLSVRPVVYLKSSIKIKSGTGEVGNPYVLE